MELKLLDLVAFNNFSKNAKNIKLVRHQDKRHDLKEIYRSNKENVLFYQEHQSSNVFDKVEYVFSFIKDESTKCLFIGAFKVDSVVTLEEGYFDKIEDDSKKELAKGATVRYNLSKLTEFEQYENRLIIDWGNAAIVWDQWFLNKGEFSESGNKTISEILPFGYVKDFPGVMNVSLSFRELKQVVNNPDAHREWKHELSSHNCIYLIFDKNTGDQYVGGTYESEFGKGIWGRWSYYASSLDGGNKRLQEIKSDKGEEYILENFHITILDILPKHLPKAQIQERESLFKRKLGTRTHGLNLN